MGSSGITLLSSVLSVVEIVKTAIKQGIASNVMMTTLKSMAINVLKGVTSLKPSGIMILSNVKQRTVVRSDKVLTSQVNVRTA